MFHVSVFALPDLCRHVLPAEPVCGVRGVGQWGPDLGAAAPRPRLLATPRPLPPAVPPRVHLPHAGESCQRYVTTFLQYWGILLVEGAYYYCCHKLVELKTGFHQNWGQWFGWQSSLEINLVEKRKENR